MNKIERKDVIFIIGMVLTVALVMLHNVKVNAAYTKPAGIQAQGRIEYDGDNSGVVGDSESDFIYDAEDIYYLYELCK